MIEKGTRILMRRYTEYMDELASIIIVLYNSSRYIEPCIDSIMKQEYPHEIIAVDNDSTDDSCRILREKYPNVRLIENKKNVGYGAGNNKGVDHAIGKYIVVLNPDTIVEEGWLEELIKPLEKGDKVITTSKILTYNGEMINTCGAINHFSGLSFTRGLGDAIDKQSCKKRISGFSGCSFAIKREHYLSLGGFDTSFFMYNEDADFSWRANLNGFKILYIPLSVVKHDYKLQITPKKLYHLEKGRYTILRKYLSAKCLLLLIPSLLITEVLTFGFASRQGIEYLYNKLLAMVHGLTYEITPVKGNSHLLISSLYDRIPDDQLTRYKLDVLIIRLCNFVYISNYACFKAIRMSYQKQAESRLLQITHRLLHHNPVD